MSRIMLFALLTLNGFLYAGPSKDEIKRALTEVLRENKGLVEQRSRSNSGEDFSPEGSLEELPLHNNPEMLEILEVVKEEKSIQPFLHIAIANRVFHTLTPTVSKALTVSGGCLRDSDQSNPFSLHASSSYDRFP